MSKDKAVAYQQYPDKAIAGTAHLTSDAFKAYWIVLWQMWLHSKNHCSMKDTGASWRRMTMGLFPDGVLKNIRAEIMDEDMPLFEKNGEFLISKGLKKEAKKQAEWRKKSQLGGLKSAEARAKVNNHPSTTAEPEGVPKGQPNGNTTSTSPLPSLPSPQSPAPQKDIIEIFNYLNEKLSTKFQARGKANRVRVQARMAEGYSVEDFKKVIDGRIQAWLTDPEMCEYLRPETLFGNKFEGYLNKVKPKSEPEWEPLEEREAQKLKEEHEAQSLEDQRDPKKVKTPW